MNLGDTYCGSGNGGGNKSLNNSKQTYLNETNVKSGKVKGIKNKSLCQIPSRFAIGMTDRGWILRNENIWWKNNQMPSSVIDRFTVDFEKVFFFTKNEKYYFNQQFEPLSKETIARCNRNFVSKRYDNQGAYSNQNQKEFSEKVKQGLVLGRNKRTVWQISTKPFRDAHFAVFPEDIPEICIQSGSPEFICNACGEPVKNVYNSKVVFKGKQTDRKVARINAVSSTSVFKTNDIVSKELTKQVCGCNAGFHGGTVLDIFMGSGTTAACAEKLNRRWIGIEINKDYCDMAVKRIKENCKESPLFALQ